MAKKTKQTSKKPEDGSSDSSAIFDVSKPGSVAASPNSRPLVVKHGPMLKQDPMVKEVDSEQRPTSSPKLKITPLSEQDQSPENANEDESKIDTEKLAEGSKEPLATKSSVEESSRPEENKTSASKEVDKQQESSESEKSGSEKTDKESNAVDALADAAEKNSKRTTKEDEEKAKKVKQLTEDKTYYLPIVEGGKKASMERFMSWLILILLILSIAAYLAVDAGYIDIGIDLPYDFIKN